MKSWTSIKVILGKVAYRAQQPAQVPTEPSDHFFDETSEDFPAAVYLKELLLAVKSTIAVRVEVSTRSHVSDVIAILQFYSIAGWILPSTRYFQIRIWK